LVKRKAPMERVYLRDYPIDYELYRKTGDFRYIHPNKLRVWIRFAEAAVEKRGRKFEEVIENVKRKMSGIKVKKDEIRQIVLPQDEFIRLKIDAMNRGIDPKWVDILAKPSPSTPLREEKLEEKKWIKVLRPSNIRSRTP